MSTSDESRECLTIRAQGRNVIVRLALKPILSFGLVLGSSKRLITDVRKHTKVFPYFQRGERYLSPLTRAVFKVVLMTLAMHVH